MKIAGRNSGVASIIIGRVRDNGRLGFGTPLFSSYAKSKAVNCLTKTSCHVKHRNHSRCNRDVTPRGTSGLAVNSSIR